MEAVDAEIDDRNSVVPSCAPPEFDGGDLSEAATVTTFTTRTSSSGADASSSLSEEDIFDITRKKDSAKPEAMPVPRQDTVHIEEKEEEPSEPTKHALPVVVDEMGVNDTGKVESVAMTGDYETPSVVNGDTQINPPEAPAELPALLGNVLPMPRLSRTARARARVGPGAVAVYPNGEGNDSSNQDADDEETGGDTNGSSTAGGNAVVNPDQPPTMDEMLFSATLVEEGQENNGQNNGLLVEAKPALEGFQAIVRNERFKYVAAFFCIMLLAIVVPVALLVPDSPSTEDVDEALLCGSASLSQTDYRGDISVTKSGKKCQRWDSQTPHSHRFGDEKENFCRNPNGATDTLSDRAWCYTADPSERWEFCDVPMCDEPPQNQTEICGTLSLSQADYRGPVNVSQSGKPCQAWASQSPWGHTNVPENHPEDGLEGNACRNPDGNRASPWCYTLDPSTVWDYCVVPACEESVDTKNDTEPANLNECGSAETNQADYVGNISWTASGVECMAWDAQIPHAHSYNPEDYPANSLESNYCRNAGGHGATWCYTMDPLVRYDYCETPICNGVERPSSEDASYTPRRQCGTPSTRQADYRGERRTSEAGRACLYWIDALRAKEDGLDPLNYPGSGLTYNFCRNPGSLKDRPWCYVEGGPSPWEYCDIKECLECGTVALKKQDYRGSLAETKSGVKCQSWDDNALKLENLIGSNISAAGEIELNLCRNPLGIRDSLWCYVDEAEIGTDWEYCPTTPDCEDEVATDESSRCGAMLVRQIDYRGALNVTATGRPCQSWSAQAPHAHKHTPQNYPFAGLSDGSYCRNPGGVEPVAWCYVDEEEVLWEYCNAPKCEEDRECGTMELNQRDYGGSISVTASGLACQAWGDQKPHAHKFDPSDYSSAGLSGNNACRNPDNSEKAWCFTQNSSVLWEFCDVPAC